MNRLIARTQVRKKESKPLKPKTVSDTVKIDMTKIDMTKGSRKVKNGERSELSFTHKTSYNIMDSKQCNFSGMTFVIG